MMQQRTSVLLIVAALVLAGCVSPGLAPGNRRSLERLRLVTALGYDSAGNGVSLSAATEGTQEGDPPLLLWRSGTGFQSVMDDLQMEGNRGELYFAHVRYLLAGRDGAEDGLGSLLAYAQRDNGLRLGVKFAVLKSGTAGDLVTASEGGFQVAKALAAAERHGELTGVSRMSDLRETIVALNEYGAAAVCLLDVTETEQGPALVPAGYGILDEDGRLSATLEGGGAEALGLVLDAGFPITRRLSGGASVRFRGGVKVLPRWTAGGTPGPVEVRVELRGMLTEQGDTVSDPEELAEELSRSIEQDLEKVFSLAVTLNADFPGLARELRISGGKRFQDLPPDWLSGLEFRYRVSAVLDREGDLIWRQTDGETAPDTGGAVWDTEEAEREGTNER